MPFISTIGFEKFSESFRLMKKVSLINCKKHSFQGLKKKRDCLLGIMAIFGCSIQPKRAFQFVIIQIASNNPRKIFFLLSLNWAEISFMSIDHYTYTHQHKTKLEFSALLLLLVKLIIYQTPSSSFAWNLIDDESHSKIFKNKRRRRKMW